MNLEITQNAAQNAILSLTGTVRSALGAERTKVSVASLFREAHLTHFMKETNEYEDRYQDEYRAMNRMFPAPVGKRRRPRSHHLDKISLIQKYQTLWLRHKFPFGIPPNFLTPQKVVKIFSSGPSSDAPQKEQ